MLRDLAKLTLLTGAVTAPALGGWLAAQDLPLLLQVGLVWLGVLAGLGCTFVFADLDARSVIVLEREEA